MTTRSASLLAPLVVTLACASPSASDEAEASEATTSASGTGEATTGDGASETAGDGGTSDGGTGGETGGETGAETGEDPWLDACPEVPTVQASGLVSNPAIDEASGLVRSRTQAWVWVHNDSGDTARLFALALADLTTIELHLDGAAALDWEDLALGPGSEPGDYLYVGDIGDNGEARPYVTIYRVREPDLAAAGPDPIVTADWQAFELTYPDGPHNAETLLVDPRSGDLFIVTKGGQTKLYRAAAPLASGELEAMPDPSYPSAIATGGDVSPLGDHVIVRGYADAWLWLRGPDEGLAEALGREPCEVPLAAEQQGETLAIDLDGRGYYTLSEGTDSVLWAFRHAD